MSRWGEEMNVHHHTNKGSRYLRGGQSHQKTSFGIDLPGEKQLYSSKKPVVDAYQEPS